MQNEYDVVTLSDNKEYVIVSKTEFQGVPYLYLVDIENNTNNMICKFDNNSLERVIDTDLLAKLVIIFNDDLKNVLAEIKPNN